MSCGTCLLVLVHMVHVMWYMCIWYMSCGTCTYDACHVVHVHMIHLHMVHVVWYMSHGTCCIVHVHVCVSSSKWECFYECYMYVVLHTCMVYVHVFILFPHGSTCMRITNTVKCTIYVMYVLRYTAIATSP